ncbi:hypothetical protein [Microbispora sp. CA-102843]|uniref:hypothetical protein n=1 Tax=Microbispora sp. CA-102843 TaxID=3239952 RepID=UPI003D9241EE
MLLRNTLEGGVNGQAITVANSGGASGNAFSFAGNGTYSSAQAAHGSFSAACAPDATMNLEWQSFAVPNGSLYSRLNFRITRPTIDDTYVSLYVGTPNTGTSYEWSTRVVMHTNGTAHLELGHYSTSGGFVTLGSKSITLPNSTWCRLELRADNSAPTSTAEARWYNQMDGTTITDSVTASTSHASVFGWNYFGASADTYQSSTNVWVDDIALSDVGWLGPGNILDATLTPGAVSASAVIPSPALSIGSTIAPGVVAATAVIPAPSIHTGALTTAVNPGVVVATAVIPSPTVDAFANVYLTPDPLVAAAVIPAPAIGVPVNPGDQIDRTGQIEWNGFLLGSTTEYRWLTLDGWWDLPDLDGGNVAHPSRHGAYAGRDLTQERHVTYTALVRARRENMQAVINELKAATRILDDDTELPLAIRVLDDILVGYGKVARRSIPIDKLVRLGHAQLTIQWTLSDPILQSRDLANAVIADGVWQSVTNVGNAPAYPTIRMPGPATGPTIFVRHTEAGRLDERALEFDLHLNAGETLLVDTYYGTAVVGEEPVMDTLAGNSVPIPDLVLPSGQSQVGYGSSGGGAPAATMLWRHSYL